MMCDAIKGKRVLLVANEGLSMSSSNGRTMANLLKTKAPDELAQFFIHGNPDFSICKHYYRVSDRDALAAIKKGIKPYTTNGLVAESEDSQDVVTVQRPTSRRNCTKLLLRHLVWRMEKWWNTYFERFLEEFSPEVVLLQAGDAPFMMRIARKIAKKFQARLIVYSSESYVLKKKLYSKAKRFSPAHLLLQNVLRQEYKKLMREAVFCIYGTEHLESWHQSKYPHAGRSAVLYTTTDLSAKENAYRECEPFSVAYCGNLGVGRVPMLASFAEVLARVDAQAKLHICGSFVNAEDEALLTAHTNVIYHGRVSYDEVVDRMSKVALIIHCENSERLENLKTAFSTKIADSLACGTPFLVYATRAYPFVQYLEKASAAHIAETEQELAEVLARCVRDSAYRACHLPNALALARKNHLLSVNAEKMKAIIENE